MPAAAAGQWPITLAGWLQPWTPRAAPRFAPPLQMRVEAAQSETSNRID
jgi:hypothetical protein